MKWFGHSNKTSAFFDPTLVAQLIGWILAYFILIWFVITSRRRRLHTFTFGSISIISGALLSIGMYDSNWMSGEGMVFFYNENLEFERTGRGDMSQMHSALQKGVPNPILSVLDFVLLNQTSPAFEKAGYMTKFFLLTALVVWFVNQLIYLFVPQLSAKLSVINGLCILLVLINYIMLIKKWQFVIYVEGAKVTVGIGRSIILVLISAIAQCIPCFLVQLKMFPRTSFEVDFGTPWDRQDMLDHQIQRQKSKQVSSKDPELDNQVNLTSDKQTSNWDKVRDHVFKIKDENLKTELKIISTPVKSSNIVPKISIQPEYTPGRKITQPQHTKERAKSRSCCSESRERSTMDKGVVMKPNKLQATPKTPRLKIKPGHLPTTPRMIYSRQNKTPKKCATPKNMFLQRASQLAPPGMMKSPGKPSVLSSPGLKSIVSIGRRNERRYSVNLDNRTHVPVIREFVNPMHLHINDQHKKVRSHSYSVTLQ